MKYCLFEGKLAVSDPGYAYTYSDGKWTEANSTGVICAPFASPLAHFCVFYAVITR